MRFGWSTIPLLLLALPTHALAQTSAHSSDPALAQLRASVQKTIRKEGSSRPKDLECHLWPARHVTGSGKTLDCPSCNRVADAKTLPEMLSQALSEIAAFSWFPRIKLEEAPKHNDLGPVYQTLAFTDAGQIILAKILPKIRTGQLRIRQITDADREMMRNDPGRFRNSAYLPASNEILLDFNDPVALLVPTLAHQATHSLYTQIANSLVRRFEAQLTSLTQRLRGESQALQKDPDWEIAVMDLFEGSNVPEIEQGSMHLEELLSKDLPAQKAAAYTDRIKELSRRFLNERNNMIFHMERDAIDTDRAVVLELSANIPCFQALAFQISAKSGVSLLYPVSDESIIRDYGLNANTTAPLAGDGPSLAHATYFGAGPRRFLRKFPWLVWGAN